MPPVLTVIGLDAATFDVIDPMLAGGQLPTLQGLFAAGSRGTLRSTIHPLTTQAWTTMTTGVNAGRHGLWDFLERDETGYGLRVVNGSFRRAPALWDRLGRSKRRLGIVNVPFSWPAPPVDGFSLAGLDAAARDDGMAHPPGLLAELTGRFGPLALDHRFPLGRDGHLDLDLVRRCADQRVAMLGWLVERYDPELLFSVFMSADHIHHIAWPDWVAHGLDSTVAEVYRILDAATGAVAELAGGGDVMVVSDHGGGSLDGVVNLNAWLAREGFLSYLESAAGLGGGALKGRSMERLDQVRRRLPQGVRNAAKRRLPALRERSYNLRRNRGFSVVDWSRTQAFAYGTFGNVVVNVRGRERDGTVEPGAEYERVRDRIIARALELRGPAGEQIVTAVHRREELFDGPAIEKVPDLIVEMADYAWLGKGNLSTRTPDIWDEISIALDSNERYVGSHRLDGIMSLSGPSALAGGQIAASIEDVAPTILYLLGEDIPTDLEGRVVSEALADDLLDRRPPTYAEADDVEVGGERRYDDDDADEVKERLRGLGYVE